MRITNDGAGDIVKNSFDDGAPLGIQVSNGKLVRAEIISASNEYLEQIARVDVGSENTAVIRPIIVESGEWLDIKSLILHDQDVRPSISAVGKIAGVREMPAVKSAAAAEKPGFIAETFRGGVLCQLARMPAYAFAFLIIILAVVIPAALISDFIGRRKRLAILRKFRKTIGREFTVCEEYVLKRYAQCGVGELEWYLRNMADDACHRGVLRYEELMERSGRESSDGELIPTRIRIDQFSDVPEMKAAGFLSQDDGKWRIDPAAKSMIFDLKRFVDQGK